MMQSSHAGHAPLAQIPDRERVAQKILGSFRNKRVLAIGIGGGGDVVSTLPTCFDLERIGATVIPAGLTWKRIVHDPYGRPRPIDHFENCAVFNNLIAEANAATRTREGVAHIEAHVSKALDGRPIAMIDISPGSAALNEALADYCKQRSIDAVIGLDAGGDVLCAGHEATLESPLCDQMILAALSRFEGSLLGVFGFGADGEMPLSDLRPRFSALHAANAYRGALPIETADISRLVDILRDAPTEASRMPIVLSQKLSVERREQLLKLLNRDIPDLESAIGTEEEIPMRGGNRVANLSHLSATTMYFEPSGVFTSSVFGRLWNDEANIDQMAEILAAAQITTEFAERERLTYRPLPK